MSITMMEVGARPTEAARATRSMRLAIGLGALLGTVTAIAVGTRVARPSWLAAHGPATAHAATAKVTSATVSARTLRAEGQVITYPNGRVVLGAEQPGTIARVLVREGDRVRKGDILVQFKRDVVDAERWAAWAHILEAGSDLRFSNADAKRTKDLVAAGNLSTSELDRASLAKNVATARRAAAGESAHAAALASRANIVAPFDGTVILREVDEGATVPQGAPLIEVADLGARRVEAEIDEADLGLVRVGGHATVGADAFGDQTWSAMVEEVPDVILPRRLKPQDPSRSTDTRVLRVKLALPPDTPLKLGQRVKVALRVDR
jgi:RND family efflux transporter MFP subunit